MRDGRFPLIRILHVDDEPDIRQVARLALVEVGGFIVESCESGAHAIDKAPIFNPDMILLDVTMPDMSGPDTLKALRAFSAATGVIPGDSPADGLYSQKHASGRSRRGPDLLHPAGQLRLHGKHESVVRSRSFQIDRP